MTYRYRVVSSNGHGLHGPEFESFKAARECAQIMVERQPTTVVLGPYEIERVGYIDRVGGSRRYWMRQRKRWVPWNYKRDYKARRPDYIWFESFDSAAKDYGDA